MSEGFTAIDNDLLDNKMLSIQEQSLLIAIISFLGNGNAHPGYKTLKHRSKIGDDRTLIKSINSLEEKGFIEVNRGKGRSNAYRLTVEMQYLQKYGTCKTTVTPTVNMQELPTVDLQYKKEIQKEKEKENIYSTPEDEELKSKYRYTDIINYWNKSGVTICKKLTTDIRRGIDNSLELKKDDGTNLTLEDIKQSIFSYADAYRLGTCKNQWRLVDFLNKKHRDTGRRLLLMFLNSGISSSRDSVSVVVEAAKEIKKSKTSTIPYQEIFDLYVEQRIVKHNTFTDGMKSAIKKAAVKFTVNEIKIAIERYGQMYRDKENQYAAQYCKYKWTLSDLLTREKGISEFLDEGGKWIRYKDKTESKKQEVQQKGLEDFF
ncbi:MAG: hypothetical protein F8N39_07155 [Clostridiaceae bacterium]|nr:hypothetical protein [Clostridiaceae bacterium]